MLVDEFTSVLSRMRVTRRSSQGRPVAQHDAQLVRSQVTGGRQQLPVPQMRREEQGAAMPVHHGSQVLETLDPDPRERLRERLCEHAGQFEDHEPEMLI